MNPSDTNAGGYAASEMRKYLTPVAGDGNSGKFLAGLISAGVPESVLWAPKRYVANGGSGATGADELADKLWLPTEREAFGGRTYSHASYETDANQARLEYYVDNGSRVKNFGGVWWWLASPAYFSSTNFCGTYGDGTIKSINAYSERGCAPAFCVK
jgi:hypothetical protein